MHQREQGYSGSIVHFSFLFFLLSCCCGERKDSKVDSQVTLFCEFIHTPRELLKLSFSLCGFRNKLLSTKRILFYYILNCNQASLTPGVFCSYSSMQLRHKHIILGTYVCYSAVFFRSSICFSYSGFYFRELQCDSYKSTEFSYRLCRSPKI